MIVSRLLKMFSYYSRVPNCLGYIVASMLELDAIPYKLRRELTVVFDVKL